MFIANNPSNAYACCLIILVGLFEVRRNVSVSSCGRSVGRFIIIITFWFGAVWCFVAAFAIVKTCDVFVRFMGCSIIMCGVQAICTNGIAILVRVCPHAVFSSRVKIFFSMSSKVNLVHSRVPSDKVV
jgi:hypothetical protein